MADEQVQQSVAAAEADSDDDEAVDQEGADYLEGLQSVTEEIDTHRERVKATADALKQSLAGHQERLKAMREGASPATQEDKLAALLEAGVSTLDTMAFLLDEQSETFMSLLGDTAALVTQNVEQLREDSDEVQEQLYELSDGELGEAPVPEASVLLPDDGGLIAALLYEFFQALESGAQQLAEGSDQRKMAEARAEQVRQAVARVQTITVQSGAAPEPPAAPAAAPPSTEPSPEPTAAETAPTQPQPQT